MEADDNFVAFQNDTRKTFSFHTIENNRSEETTVALPEYVATTSLVICSVVLAVGLLGNSLVIIVVLSNKLLRSSTNLFLLNLSVADLLVLATSTPTSLVEIALRTDAFLLGKAMCYFVPFVELSVSHTSVLTILAITVERYYAICLPLQAGVVWTKSKACLTCVVSWLFAFGLTAPILAMIKYIPDEKSPVCLTQVDNFWSKFYFVFIIIVFFFIPFLILVLLYRHIARHLVPPSQSNAANNTNHEGTEIQNEQVVAESSAVIRSRRQVVGMLFAVVVFFFACILPFKLLTLWIVTSPFDIMEVIDEETYFNLLYFCRVMFYLNSAINPILYNVMSSKFRDGFKRVFTRCSGKSQSPYGRGGSTFYTGGTHTIREHSPRVTTTATTHSFIARTENSSIFERMSSGFFGSNSSRTASVLGNQNNPEHSSPQIKRLLSKSHSTRLPDEQTTAIIEENSTVNEAIANGANVNPRKGRIWSSEKVKSDKTSPLGKRKNHGSTSKKSSSHHNISADPSSSAANCNSIVFIEERKILVIPTQNTQNNRSSSPSSVGSSPGSTIRVKSDTFTNNKTTSCYVPNPIFDEHDEDDAEE